jgi:CBS domain containing-hemolysin-like protein
MTTGMAIAIMVVLVAVNGLFVAAEFALISARRSNIEPMAQAGSKQARATLRAMEHVSLMLATAQLGITVCSLGIGALGEPAVASALEPVLHALGLPAALLHPLAFAIALAIEVYLHMVGGEMVPKNLSLSDPERAALLLGPPLAGLERVAHPIIWALNQAANLVLRVLGVQPKDEIAAAFTGEEVARLIAESRSAGLLDRADQELLTSALELADKTAAAIAVPVADLVMVPARATPQAVQQATAHTGFSRLLLHEAAGALVG